MQASADDFERLRPWQFLLEMTSLAESQTSV